MDEPFADLTAAQAAARLGIKQETLYAYVSRGLLRRERTAAGSDSTPSRSSTSPTGAPDGRRHGR